MLGGVSNYAVGLGYGLGGRAMSMLTRGGQAGYNLGQLSRFLATSAWATNTGRGAMIGAGVGAGWGMISGDTSVLGGAAMGAIGGAGIGRYGGAAWGARGPKWNTAAGAFAAAEGGTWAGLGAARPFAGSIASNMGGGALGQLRSDISFFASPARAAVGKVFSNSGAAAATTSARAAAAPAGASLAANAPVSRVGSTMTGPYVVGTNPVSLAGRLGGPRRGRTTAGYWMVGG